MMLHLDWPEIVKKIQSFATSGSAKMQIIQSQDCSDEKAALLSVDHIFAATEIIVSGVRPHMESLDLFEPWYSRIKKNGVLKPIEMKDVRSFCLETLALKETLENISLSSLSHSLNQANSWAKNTAQTLMSAEEPLSAIDQLLTPSGDIRSDASEKLYRLFREKENLSRQIQNNLDRLIKDHNMDNFLQDKYVTTREGRWVLPIRSGSQHFVDGVIHGSSQTKQTVFIEPEAIVPVNNRLRQVEVEIEDEIERLLVELSNYLYSIHNQFSDTRHVLEEVDILLAKAQWTSQIDGQAFTFSKDEIYLNEVRHPLLVTSGKPVIANTVQLQPKKPILLLSGPNAGGKTVLLKSIGLAAQMAKAGLPICAGPNSKLPFFNDIHVGIGDAQNVGQELSTFAAHLKILDHAAKLEGHENLVLIDEICGATDPEEGSALARSFIEQFEKNKIFAVITSHLGPLKTGWTEESGVLNGSLEYDTKSGKPTYQFLQGIAGDSLAIQTAKRVGVVESIVKRAIELLSPVTQKRLMAMEELDQMKSDIQSLKQHLKTETDKSRAEKEKYQNLLKTLESDKSNILEKFTKQAEKKLEEMISEAKAEQTFKKHLSLQNIKMQLPEIVKAKPQSTASIESADDFARRFPSGTRVFVARLNRDGVVQSAPNAKGDVTILSQSVRLSLPWQDLKPPQQGGNPTADILRKSPVSANITIALHDSDKIIDLRGMTTQEAISQLEIELDRSVQTQEDRIKIVHGHGTEALKKAVRTYLSRSVYVKKWKAGSPEQGGDGITWAELGSQ